LKTDACVYTKGENNSKIILIIYVDDLVYVGPSVKELDTFQQQLSKAFQATHEDTLTWILGIAVTRKGNTTTLSQAKYISEVIDRFAITAGISTPAATQRLDQSMKPKTEEERIQMKEIPYLQAVGSIGYAATCTRPDIQFAFGMAGRYSSDPGMQHWEGVRRILKYIYATKDLQLTFVGRHPNEPVELTGMVDSDWAGDKDTRRSTTGFVFYLDDSPIAWSSKIQRSVACSSCEAEYIALSTAAQEGIYLLHLLQEIGVEVKLPIVIAQDNQGSIAMAENPVHHSKAKHIDIRYHFVRELVHNKTIQMTNVKSEHNTADILTKPLERTKFGIHRSALMGGRGGAATATDNAATSHEHNGILFISDSKWGTQTPQKVHADGSQKEGSKRNNNTANNTNHTEQAGLTMNSSSKWDNADWSLLDQERLNVATREMAQLLTTPATSHKTTTSQQSDDDDTDDSKATTIDDGPIDNPKTKSDWDDRAAFEGSDGELIEQHKRGNKRPREPAITADSDEEQPRDLTFTLEDKELTVKVKGASRVRLCVNFDKNNTN
jgi:hypothetical protein